MSAEHIMITINKLISVHQDLNKQAEAKTDVIKNGDMQALESLLKKEEAAVSRLKELETARSRHVREFLEHKGILAEDVTLIQLATFVNPEEKEKLLQLQQQLLNEIVNLKQQNKLNEDLIEQSLQFVNVSLDLLQPEAEPVNYQRPNQAETSPKKGRSIFDSRA